MRVFLGGLSALSSRDDVWTEPPSGDWKKAAEDLEALVLSSRSACSLLGCLYVARGCDFARALDVFQRALEMDEKRGLEGTREHRGKCVIHYARESFAKEFIHFIAISKRPSETIFTQNCTFPPLLPQLPRKTDTVSNMAHCFALLGEAGAAVELLLYILTMAPSPKCELNGSNVTTKLVLTKDRCLPYNGYGKKAPCLDGVPSDDLPSLMWRLLYASSLSGDWVTCLSATEELCKGGDQVATASIDDGGTGNVDASCARAFVLLQCHRPSLAMERCDQIMSARLGKEDVPLEISLVLYKADAIISTEAGFYDNANDGVGLDVEKGGGGVQAVQELTCRALALLQEMILSNDHKNHTEKCNGLEVATRNNHGIASIMRGETMDAMRHFKDAALAEASGRLGNIVDVDRETTTRSCNLQPHFNLTLLLWREGHRTDAAETWLSARDFIEGGLGHMPVCH